MKEGGNDAIGGDIIHITDLLGELLQVHEKLAEQENNYEENIMLTTNVLNTTNHLFSSTIGWEEISLNHTRHKTASNMLSTSDSVGYLLFKLSILPRLIGKSDYYVFEGS